jgi:lysozyme family protein
MIQAGSLQWYANLWDSAKLSIDNYSLTCLKHAKYTALQYRDYQYKPIELATGVPWYVVAALHMRECDFDFRCTLHNGEKIIGTNRVTEEVPKGRGPFATFKDGAIDALVQGGLNLVKDWSLENTLKVCEAYNGLGYLRYHQSVMSPYLWSCTSVYSCGLYDSDGSYDPELKDKNAGVAALFKCLDGDVTFTRAVI